MEQDVEVQSVLDFGVLYFGVLDFGLVDLHSHIPFEHMDTKGSGPRAAGRPGGGEIEKQP